MSANNQLKLVHHFNLPKIIFKFSLMSCVSGNGKRSFQVDFLENVKHHFLALIRPRPSVRLLLGCFPYACIQPKNQIYHQLYIPIFPYSFPQSSEIIGKLKFPLNWMKFVFRLSDAFNVMLDGFCGFHFRNANWLEYDMKRMAKIRWLIKFYAVSAINHCLMG